jgi:uncharacterized LabA/DUF88 family protein
MSIQSNKNLSSSSNQPSPSNDVAIFLDLDNLVIGAKQINLTFNINVVLEHIKKLTNGRIVLRRSYGDWRQDQQLMRELATAGFVTQSAIRLNNFSKNLADMQIIVDTMETLLDGREYSTYVLMTGDRDFTPLVQSLRKRGKQVIGVGVRHTTSQSFASLCDQYIYYEEIVPKPELTDTQVETLLRNGLQQLLSSEERVRASVLKKHLSEGSLGAFEKSQFGAGSFRKFLEKYPHLVTVLQVETTLYVTQPKQKKTAPVPLHILYRRALKKQRLRVVNREQRFIILKDIVQYFSDANGEQVRWRELIDSLADRYKANGKNVSKNGINAMLLLARRAQVVRTLKGKSLATAPVLLEIKGNKIVQEAIMRCDAVYVKEILALKDEFNEEEAAVALYYEPKYGHYLKTLIKNFDRFGL